MPLKVSYYDLAETQRTDVKRKGFDYKNKIFERTMSHTLFNEEKRAGILMQMETIVYELVQRVKTIKLMYGITSKKKYRDFN